MSSAGEGPRARVMYFWSHDGLLCAGTGGRGLSSEEARGE